MIISKTKRYDNMMGAYANVCLLLDRHLAKGISWHVLPSNGLKTSQSRDKTYKIMKNAKLLLMFRAYRYIK